MESSITGQLGICLLWRIKMGNFKFGLKLEIGGVECGMNYELHNSTSFIVIGFRNNKIVRTSSRE